MMVFRLVKKSTSCAFLISFSIYASAYSIEFYDGVFYGPGNMPDVPMPKGRMYVVDVDKHFNGETPYFNNGEQEPNIPSFIGRAASADGKLSDGTPYNENMDGGVVDVGNGALKLLNVVTSKGPHKGTQKYALTKNCDWKITTDLALDPGYGAGILVTENLIITSGLVTIPPSLQTVHGIPGATRSAGSVPAGALLVGKLGDFDDDGYLDGRVVGMAVIPLDHIFYPGAAVAQSRDFVSDIPVAPEVAAMLMLANSLNYQVLFDAHNDESLAPSVRDFYRAKTAQRIQDLVDQLNKSEKLLSKKTEFKYAIGPVHEVTDAWRKIQDENDIVNSMDTKKTAPLFSRIKAIVQDLQGRSNIQCS